MRSPRSSSVRRQQPSRPAWIEGVSRASPIVLGYVPIGIAFGVLAQQAGVAPLNALLMSVIVFAGSAQLIAVGMIAADAPPASIVLTTFVVNLRHLLMSAALSPHLRCWRLPEIARFSFELTDETFALHSTRFAAGQPAKIESFASNATAHAAWVFGSWIGVALGTVIGNVEALGLDYALPAMFIALLVLQIEDRRQVIVAVLTGGLALALQQVGFDQWSVIVATVIGATIGLGGDTWINRPSS